MGSMGFEVIPDIFGSNPLVHVLIIATLFAYLYLFIAKPKLARKCAKGSLKTIRDLAIPIIAALFIASAVKSLVSPEIIAGFLGEQAGLAAVFLGVLIGSVLPACSFISFPIIAGVYSAGASLAVVMAMLFGSGLAFPCRITCDLTFFNTKVAGVRTMLSFLTAIIAGLLVYFII